MTQMNKFEDLNGRFTSLGTRMTQRYKFEDRWCTLLFFCDEDGGEHGDICVEEICGRRGTMVTNRGNFGRRGHPERFWGDVNRRSYRGPT